MPDPTIIVAIVGGFFTVASSWLAHRWGRHKTQADTELVAANTELAEANTELVEANARTVVIDNLVGEVTRLTAKVNGLSDEVAQVQRDLAEQKVITARVAAEKDLIEHRFEVLVDHHGHVVQVATEAGVMLPPPPASLAAYLRIKP